MPISDIGTTGSYRLSLILSILSLWTHSKSLYWSCLSGYRCVVTDLFLLLSVLSGFTWNMVFFKVIAINMIRNSGIPAMASLMFSCVQFCLVLCTHSHPFPHYCKVNSGVCMLPLDHLCGKGIVFHCSKDVTPSNLSSSNSTPQRSHSLSLLSHWGLLSPPKSVCSHYSEYIFHELPLLWIYIGFVLTHLKHFQDTWQGFG